MTTLTQSQSRATAILLGTAMLAAIVFWFAAAVPYFTTNREAFGRYPDLYWDRRIALWIHIAGGTVAMFIGPIQIWLGETRQRLALHKTLGLAYLGGVAVTCAAAFQLSLTSPVGLIFSGGLFGMALACSVATSIAYLAIARRDFVQHREWIIRSYIVILSFVVFRLIAVSLEAAGVGGTGMEGDTIRASFAAWASWSIPLLVTEVCLQLPKLRGR
ncbi:MAG: DUF2306 domain-containing protein [Acidobacteria bacterium]|nr:DUF2306 domain-containing protein [Acidobacteriota bacterium]